MGDNKGTWLAFLSMCFAVVGLAGLFATFAAPLPYQRAIHRLDALDRGEAMPPQSSSQVSRPGAVAGPPPSRAAILADAEREAASVAFRLRFLLIVLTLVAAGFGSGVMLLYRRQANPPQP